MNSEKQQKSTQEKPKAPHKGAIKTTYPAKLYRVGPGNNSALVDRVIRSRPWWRKAPDEKVRPQFIWQQSSKGLFFDKLNSQQLANHLPWGIELGSKMKLFQNCSRYLQGKGKNPFSIFPVTYIINQGEKDDLPLFEQHFSWLDRNLKGSDTSVSSAPPTIRKACKKTPPETNEHNIWIVKPLGFNRGLGITVVNNPAQAIDWMKKGQDGLIRLTNDVDKMIGSEDDTDKEKLGPRITKWVIQKYIEHPLLFNGRKFDLRVYMLVTGKGDAFFYRDGYLRMASSIYSSENLSREVHLTNNAVQKHLTSYGCDEAGNMRMLASLDEYVSGLLLKRFGNNKNEDGTTYSYVTQYLHPRMREIIAYAAASAVVPKNADSTVSGCFELYGVDFMIDDNLNVFLIEMNVNPCLELACNVSWSILPYLLDDVLALTLDTYLPIQPTIFSSALTKRQRKGSDSSDSSGPATTAATLTTVVTASPSSPTSQSSLTVTQTSTRDERDIRALLSSVGDKVLLRCDNDCPPSSGSSPMKAHPGAGGFPRKPSNGALPGPSTRSPKAIPLSHATKISVGDNGPRRTKSLTKRSVSTKTQGRASDDCDKAPERLSRSRPKSITSPQAASLPKSLIKTPGVSSPVAATNTTTTATKHTTSPIPAEKCTSNTNNTNNNNNNNNAANTEAQSPNQVPQSEQNFVPPKGFPYDAWPTWANVPRPTWPAWAGQEREEKEKSPPAQTKELMKEALETHIRLRWDAVAASGDYPTSDQSGERRKLSDEETTLLQGFRHRPNNFEMVMSRFRPLRVRHVKLELPKPKGSGEAPGRKGEEIKGGADGVGKAAVLEAKTKSTDDEVIDILDLKEPSMSEPQADEDSGHAVTETGIETRAETGAGEEPATGEKPQQDPPEGETA